MVTIEKIREHALSFPETTEEPHFHKISFRVTEKIFATYGSKDGRVSVKLKETDQDIYSLAAPDAISPVPNKWGKQGWTLIDASRIPEDLFWEVLTKAYCNVAPQALAVKVISR